jgi:predicted NBD/HSP70 family sugar kinase
MNACDLHLCIVGGGISQAETFLLGQARRTLRARVLQPIATDVRLCVAALSVDAGIVGAAMLAMTSHP